MLALRRLLVLLTLVASLLQGVLAQPVSARQCLRVMGVEHCVDMANPVAHYGEKGHPAPAVLPSEIGLVAPARLGELSHSTPARAAAQRVTGPEAKPPRL